MGGAQSVLLQILRKLDRDRFSPAVVCLFGGDSTIADDIRAIGVEVTDLKMIPRWNITAVWRYYRLLRREKPDIVHAALFHASLLSRLVGHLARLPVIVTWRQSVELGSPIREWLNRWTSRWDDGVVAVCEPVRQAELERGGGPPERVKVLYNCVDVEQISALASADSGRLRSELGIPDGSLVVGMVGRLHPTKGVDVLLQAMQSIARDGFQARLVVVGDGPLKEDLMRTAGRLAIADVTIFTGSRSDVPALLGALDLLVLPSLWEGLPLAILEAMAARLPVVATDVGGNSEAVVDGVTGLLVPPGDVPALSRAIRQLATDGAQRRQMGQAGYERALRLFSAQTVANRFAELYLALLAEKGVA
jgi:glycosyltransferase involved in cell wall biosynthesis